MSRKLTSYPWKACQRDIRFNFASKEAASAMLGVFSAAPSFENSQADSSYKDTWDVKEARRFNRVTEQWGGSSRSQVLLNGFLLLYVSSDHLSGLRRTSVPNTHTLYRRSHPVNQTRSGMSLSITSGCERLWRHAPTLVRGARAGMSTSTFVCVYGKAGLTPCLFLG